MGFMYRDSTYLPLQMQQFILANRLSGQSFVYSHTNLCLQPNVYPFHESDSYSTAKSNPAEISTSDSRQIKIIQSSSRPLNLSAAETSKYGSSCQLLNCDKVGNKQRANPNRTYRYRSSIFNQNVRPKTDDKPRGRGFSVSQVTSRNNANVKNPSVYTRVDDLECSKAKAREECVLQLQKDYSTVEESADLHNSSRDDYLFLKKGKASTESACVDGIAEQLNEHLRLGCQDLATSSFERQPGSSTGAHM